MSADEARNIFTDLDLGGRGQLHMSSWSLFLFSSEGQVQKLALECVCYLYEIAISFADLVIQAREHIAMKRMKDNPIIFTSFQKKKF